MHAGVEVCTEVEVFAQGWMCVQGVEVCTVQCTGVDVCTVGGSVYRG